jgi:hypothetical protein
MELIILSTMPIPKQAIKNAKNALRKRNQFKDKPMTSSGVKTAKQLTTGYYSKNREGKIYSFLARSIKAQEKNPTKRRQVAIDGWGGKSLYNYLKKKRG